MRLMKKGLALLLAIGMLLGTCADSVLAAENGLNDAIMDSSGEADDVTAYSEIIDDSNENANITDSEDKKDSTGEKDNLTDADNDMGNSNETNDSEKSDEIINSGETENPDSENSAEDSDSDESNAEDNDSDEDNIEDNESDEENAEDVTDEEELENAEEIAAVEDAEIFLSANDNGEVSRIEWLAELTALFEMSVEKDNYPDNYYSDLDSSSEYYYDAMLATEFGLIDVEAGEELKPDDAANREFAAHTLNFCLGYMPQEDGEYTFNESNKVTYADDIQIAIDRGWFELVDGDFLPDMAITASEKSEMLADARLVLEAAKPDPTHTNTYTFADDVIDLTKADISVELTDVTELTFYNCSETLTVGNKYGMEQGGLPMVFKVTSVTETEEGKVVQFEAVPMDEAFKDIDIQGSMDIDLASVLPYNDDVEMYYIVGGTEEEQWEDGIKYDTLEEVGDQEISAIEAVTSYSLSDSFSQDVDIGSGVKATVSCKVSDVKPEFKADYINRSAYVGVNAKVSFSCSVSANLLESAGIVPNLKLVYIPIYGIGYFDINMYAMMGGKLTLDMVEKVHIGLSYENKTFRMEKSFTKDSFTIQTRIEMEISATAELGMSLCSFMSGKIYAKLGIKNVLDTIIYNDENTPKMCGHQSAWLYAKVGAAASVNFGFEKKSWSKDYNIYDEYNSPVRVSFHYEDGVAVSGCTRGTKYGASGRSWKYYTSANSRYGYNGASSGIGSNGEPYTIFEYSLDKYDNATITSYKGNVSALSIPETLDGYTVVGIGSRVFQKNQMLRTLVVPDSVVEIGSSAFAECINLSNVKLSSSLVSLGSRAFYNCDLITEIVIPKSLEEAGVDGPFKDCDGLKKVSFEQGTTEIATYLFRDCTGLEEIDIPDTVTIIELSAFQGCTNLCKVTIPGSVTKISSFAFQKCNKLETIIIPDSVVEIGSSVFSECINLSSVKMSGSLVSLGSRAFYNCDSITEIVIPKSLEEAGVDGPFRDCDGLKKVSFEQGTTEIATYLFRDCTGLEEIDIPDTVTIIELSAFQGCTNLCKVTIPDSVTKVSDLTFQNCSKLETITLPDSITDMGTHVFSGCATLKEAILPNTISEIKNNTFKDCASLEKVNFPETIENIGNYAFYNTKLNEAVLPEKVKRIGDYAFYNCDALTTITIPDSVTSLGTYIFAESELLSDVTLGTGITTIPAYAFNLCPSLKKIVIPYRVTEIKGNAFTNCTTLTEITIPRSVTSIASGVFSYPSKLTIYGISGTYAETYANSIGATFVHKEVKATSVSLNNEELKIAKGVKATLILSVIPSDFTDEVVWKSTDESIVSVDDKGVVTAKSLGTATVKVTVGNLSASCKVTVTQPVTSISLNKTSLSLEAFESYKLTATVLPSTAENKEIIWSSSDEEIASVDENGSVTAHAKGSATIRVEAQDGSEVYKECSVTVVNNGYICSNANEMESEHDYPVNSSDFWIYTKEGAEKLYITFDARTDIEEDFDFLYIYDAQGNQVGKYTGTQLAGQVVEVEGDTVKIKLVSDDSGTTWGFKVTSISDSDNITVTQPVTSISLNKTSLSLEAFESDTLTVEVLPSTAENKAVIWSSSDEKIASVDENGSVTAHAKGSATIRVEAQDGSGIYEECSVTVVNNGYICSDANEMESEHDYPVNSSDFWIYTEEGAEKLYITFDARTDIEEGIDYLYIYDAQGNQVGKYTGTQLAGQVVEVEGDTVKIKLVSDDSGTTWGFKVAAISTGGNVENDEYTVTFDSQGGSAVSAVQVPKNTPVACPTAPVRSGYNFLGWYLNGTLYDFSQPVTENIVLRAKWERIIDEPDVGDNEEILEGDMPENGVIPDGLWIAGVSEQIYTGKALKPDVRVYDGKRRLKAGTDYTISYKNNVKATYDFDETSPSASAPAVIVKGKGNYSGTAKAFFKINPIDITNNPSISADDITLLYNEQSQMKEPKVTYNGKKLSAKKDYVSTYPDAGVIYGAYREVGDYTVRIEGRGNFAGSMDVKLSITDKQLIEKAKTVKIKDKTYDKGNAVTLSESELIVYMKSKNEPLTRDVDYKVSYENNREIGTAYAVISGIGDYAGVKKVKFKINGISIKKAQIEGISNKVYNGEEQKQDIAVRLDGILLTEGADYIINYDNNCKKVGTVRMTVQGIGEYTGSIKKSYKITAYDLNIDEHNMISELPQDLTVKYSAGGSKPSVELKFGDVKLVEGTDYKISYKNNKNIADISSNKAPTAVIKGIGNFKGSVSMKFSIQKKNIADAEDALTLIVADVAYVKGAGKYISKPILRDAYGKTLKAGSDYEVTYMLSDGVTKLTKKDIVPVDTDVCMSIVGKGKYEGTINTTYRIKSNNLQKAKIIITPKNYTGKKVYLTEEDITVMLGNDNRLVLGVDYEIVQESYANHTNKGTASVMIKGIGNYGGMKTAKFKIGAKRMEAFESVVRKLKESLLL